MAVAADFHRRFLIPERHMSPDNRVKYPRWTVFILLFEPIIAYKLKKIKKNSKKSQKNSKKVLIFLIPCDIIY